MLPSSRTLGAETFSRTTKMRTTLSGYIFIRVILCRIVCKCNLLAVKKSGNLWHAILPSVVLLNVVALRTFSSCDGERSKTLSDSNSGVKHYSSLPRLSRSISKINRLTLELWSFWKVIKMTSFKVSTAFAIFYLLVVARDNRASFENTGDLLQSIKNSGMMDQVSTFQNLLRCNLRIFVISLSVCH